MDVFDSILFLGRHLPQLLYGEDSSPQSIEFKKIIAEANHYNRWFTPEEIKRRLDEVCAFISGHTFEELYSTIPQTKNVKSIAVVSEENIPLEEFFTIVSILLSNNNVVYKTSDKQEKLLPFIFKLLTESNPELSNKISFIEGPLRRFDKIIVTSRNPWPENKRNFILKHKSLEIVRCQSVGIVQETDTVESLSNFATDVFSFFGMGCGNAKKIFVPENFPLARIFEAFESWHDILNHNSYANNYQYHQSVYLMNRIEHLDNGFLLLKPDKAMQAPTGVLYYEYYKDEKALAQRLEEVTDINTVYTSTPKKSGEKPFGNSVNQLLLPSKQVIDFII